MRDADLPCCELEFWAYLIICFILVSLAGITSGLALGLLSFSHVELEVFIKAGLPQDQKNAGKILPLVKKEHLLLCTLLIVKSLAMEALPVFLDPILPSWAAILVSVTLVLAFAEIIPQALCARYGLSVGAKLSVFVRFLLLIFYPIAYPISKLLDWLLGKAHSALLRRAELKTLVCLHANEAGKGGDLSHHETTIISGALDLTQKTAKDAMTPISESFTLDINSKLNRHTMELIMRKGHSRIPVYSGSSNNVIGLILVKSLIFCNHEDETPIKCMPIRRIPRVSEDFPLYSILNQFRKGHSHNMAVVVKSKKDVKSTVSHAVCKQTELDIVTRSNTKPTQTEGKANIYDRGISSPFYQTEHHDISTRNASPLYSNYTNYPQNKDLNPSRKNWEQRDEYISLEDLESRQNDLDEEVIGIITMEDVLEELLQEEILDEADKYVDLHNKSRTNLMLPSRRLMSPRSPGSISVSHLQWTSTPDQPSPLSTYTPILLRSPIPPYIVSPLIRPILYASPGRFIMNSRGQFVGLVGSSPSAHRGRPQKLNLL